MMRSEKKKEPAQAGGAQRPDGPRPQPVPAAPAAAPSSTPTTRFLQRLPQLVTFFFSLTLVHGFRILADTFHFTTRPTFDAADPSQLLVVLSFLVTLFWIVTAWMGYSLLIERFPYTLSFSRFFFDVARFSIMFAQLNFAFLVATVESYHVYIFGVTFFHLLMVGWYIRRILNTPDGRGRQELKGDARSHGLAGLTYLLLGIVYYLGVATRPGRPFSDLLRYVVVAATFLFITIWSLKRLSELKRHATGERK